MLSATSDDRFAHRATTYTILLYAASSAGFRHGPDRCVLGNYGRRRRPADRGSHHRRTCGRITRRRRTHVHHVIAPRDAHERTENDFQHLIISATDDNILLMDRCDIIINNYRFSGRYLLRLFTATDRKKSHKPVAGSAGLSRADRKPEHRHTAHEHGTRRDDE